MKKGPAHPMNLPTMYADGDILHNTCRVVRFPEAAWLDCTHNNCPASIGPLTTDEQIAEAAQAHTNIHN